MNPVGALSDDSFDFQPMFIENRGIGLRIGHESGILGEIEESVNLAYT